MMEKQNRTVEKDAAGDAGALDDIVDMAAGKMEVRVESGSGRAARRKPMTRLPGPVTRDDA